MFEYEHSNENREKISQNVTINNQHFTEFETIREFADCRKDQLKDLLFFIAQTFGEGIENNLSEKKEAVFDNLFDYMIPKDYGLSDYEKAKFQKLMLDYNHDGRYSKLVSGFVDIMYETEQDRGLPNTKEEFRIVFNNDLNEMKASTGFDILQTSKEVTASFIISDVYKNIIMLNEEALDGINLLSLVNSVVVGLFFHLQRDKDYKLSTPINSIQIDGKNILISKIEKINQLIELIHQIFKSLIHRPDLFNSITAKLKSKGVSSSPPAEPNKKIDFDISYDDIFSGEYNLSDDETFIITAFKYIIDEDKVSIITDAPGIDFGWKGVKYQVTMLAQLINILYKNTWVKQQIKKEELLYTNGDWAKRKKFQKGVSRLYREYSYLYDDVINPNPKPENEVSDVDRVVEELGQNIVYLQQEILSEPESLHIYEYRPFTPAETGEAVRVVKTEKIITKQSVITRLAEYGDDSGLKNVEINGALLKYMDSIIDFIDNFVGHIESLNRALSYEMKYGDLIFKEHQALNRMKIGSV